MKSKVDYGKYPYYGIYPTRYLAKKEAKGDEKVVRVEGGYKIMSYTDYNIWKNQK